MKKFFIWLLATLKGKKTTIGTVLALINTYLLTVGIYGNNEAILFNGILVSLGLTANIADSHLNINANKQFGK
jgi:hypothetical protein